MNLLSRLRSWFRREPKPAPSQLLLPDHGESTRLRDRIMRRGRQLRPIPYVPLGDSPNAKPGEPVRALHEKLMGQVGIPKHLMEQMRAEPEGPPRNWDWLFDEAAKVNHPVYDWPRGPVSLFELNVLSNVADPHHGFMRRLPGEVQRAWFDRARRPELRGKRQIWWDSSRDYPFIENMTIRVLLFDNGWEGVRRGVFQQDGEVSKFFSWEPDQPADAEPRELVRRPEFWCYDPCFCGPNYDAVVPAPESSPSEVETPSPGKEVVVSLPEEGGQPHVTIAVVPTVNRDFVSFLESLPDTSDDPSAWTPMAGSIFDPEVLSKAEAPTWEECPPRTVALSLDGSCSWVKQEDGRWLFNNGMFCEAPGDKAALVRLPEASSCGESLNKACGLPPVEHYFNPPSGEVPDFKQDYQGIPTSDWAGRARETCATMCANDSALTRVDYLLALLEHDQDICLDRGERGAVCLFDNLIRVAKDVRQMIIKEQSPSAHLVWPSEREPSEREPSEREPSEREPSERGPSELLCCVVCGSTGLQRGANLEQNRQTGAWEVRSRYDDFFCPTCEDETGAEPVASSALEASPTCQACGEALRGHEDESGTHCRWCVTCQPCDDDAVQSAI